MDVRRKSEHRGTESAEEAGTGGGGTEKKEGEMRERAKRNGAKAPKLHGQYTARDSGSAFEGDAFAGDENCSGRLDGEFFGIVTLIDGDADAAARVLIEERFADGNVHEGFAEGENERFAVEVETDFVADGVTEGAKIVALNVGDKRAEGIVEADDVAGDSFLFDDGDFRAEANELRNDGASDGVIPTGGEMRGGGRKNIAAVKSGRDGGREHPGGVGDFVGRFEAVAIEDRRDEAVVGQNEILALLSFDDDGFARSANAGIDDGEKNGAGGVVRRNGCEKARRFFDLIWRHLMRDVHDARVGGDVDDYGFADGGGVVGGAEIGHEDDRGRWCGRGGVILLAAEFAA